MIMSIILLLTSVEFLSVHHIHTFLVCKGKFTTRPLQKVSFLNKKFFLAQCAMSSSVHSPLYQWWTVAPVNMSYK